MKLLMTITGKDQPGIIAAFTGAIFKCGGNLEDANMTILEGEFAMILLAEIGSASGYRKFVASIERIKKTLALSIQIRPIKRRLTRGEKHLKGSVPYILSVYGRDHAGIVYQVSKVLADEGLNITDLNSNIAGSGKNSIYALILEVDAPQNARIRTVEKKIDQIKKKLKVDVSFKPLETARL
ncbi:MAG: hypothetical protein A3G33_07155 [Omnitrophica bacterium RIFCSPLOWO2_12_FULL_44_17]|uniref:ACT domain-containing protein n=1 Tax=Candidatus Danuiimicrobium aquiferis TaxID=1801832 RepID=A0A1G1KYJ7_9BACT|nr:MAG: hypothetical protein A3B72_07450 [Omnitrophica bacterium RIFCSPHIGHO2_02_FULL_45_28]OGW90384.1 MAG: hypothetical protein A3E74_07190 [Omnitrophica bacterium RIFCSPHIGHO2_12_FULL_44_12]OGW98005.1 MAG: hypothetical protein A3G33_07155 [Omnitrophica bacterium RIFCSPLOWO2_12_FULL_44_17]OGX03550.1 MAG: hypothetical protein A3J12_03075 [Omnitrophica bacterium RIFCSPLOWO2_02_FULL_44_11]